MDDNNKKCCSPPSHFFNNEPAGRTPEDGEFCFCGKFRFSTSGKDIQHSSVPLPESWAKHQNNLAATVRRAQFKILPGGKVLGKETVH